MGSYLWRMILDLRTVQRPLKKKYRDEPGSSRITLEAKASQQDTPISCSVDVGRAIYEAEAHKGVGGTGEVACSGDLLLGALAACAQVTCQMVAEAMGIDAEKIEVIVEGDMDLAGTLGVSQEVPVGFETIRTTFDIVAPEATEEQLEKLRREPSSTASSTRRWPIHPSSGRSGRRPARGRAGAGSFGRVGDG
jgi:uncharacterized OsmC-like protein